MLNYIEPPYFLNIIHSYGEFHYNSMKGGALWM